MTPVQPGVAVGAEEGAVCVEADTECARPEGLSWQWPAIQGQVSNVHEFGAAFRPRWVDDRRGTRTTATVLPLPHEWRRPGAVSSIRSPPPSGYSAQNGIRMPSRHHSDQQTTLRPSLAYAHRGTGPCNSSVEPSRICRFATIPLLTVGIIACLQNAR
ncbi:unnamed protein product [Protopolystoma xenopodis]|uniref:Uncharacterized protein n=1 Tax=Protopolystoma xenopodis TaxID=117903 RepID=A0A3S5AWG0_9PLAT|nr:unnamed protein product [Protopolystoma xenopodis]